MNITDQLLAELLANLAGLAGRPMPAGASIGALVLTSGQVVTFGKDK
jgi:hypothetical protein